MIAQYDGITIDQSNTETHNVLGEKASVTDANGQTTTYYHNATGDLIQVIGVDGVAINTFFDAYGRKIGKAVNE